jgi:hypothetical protein
MQSSPHTKRSPWTRVTRPILAGGYLLAIVVCLDHDDAPRWLWTVAMPLLPLLVVAVGFHAWRRLCPLAAVATLGARLARRRRRLPRWVDRWALSIAFVSLLAGLVLRHVLLNGDHTSLGCALMVLALGAIGCNATFSGKTWCNVVCPIGVVERIYTDGGSLRATPSSSCQRCTGCKSACPDIDSTRAYAKDVTHPARRFVTYGFPGLVLAFYGYYALRHGEWAAFFDGRWTRRPFDVALAFGPGFTFAPGVPAWLAAVVTLAAGAGVSFLIFAGIELVLRRRGADPRLLRHRLLSIASFASFNGFYLFAGQPTLQYFPLADRTVTLIVPVLATLVLARRWSSLPPRRSPRSLPVLPPGKVAPHVPPSPCRASA